MKFLLDLFEQIFYEDVGQALRPYEVIVLANS